MRAGPRVWVHFSLSGTTHDMQQQAHNRNLSEENINKISEVTIPSWLQFRYSKQASYYERKLVLLDCFSLLQGGVAMVLGYTMTPSRKSLMGSAG